MRNQVSRLNASELKKESKDNASWHDSYKNSPHVYIGGLPFELNEGDVLTVFAQYGKIKKINLVREKDTHKSKGFAFLSYDSPKSAVLAVDNFDGIMVLNFLLFRLLLWLVFYF
jgi:RNA-binding motif X-linked protein 2